MYLSRLTLNLKNRKTRKDLSDCHDMHRTIMSAFPDTNYPSQGARSQFGVLYRVENTSLPAAVNIYVQSLLKPEWTCLPQGYLLEVRDNPACKEITQQYSRLKDGMTLRFRLNANPTKKVTKPGPDGKMPRQGKRVELYREEDQIKWLFKKANDHGFALSSVSINNKIPDVRLTARGKISGLAGKDIATKQGENQIDRLTLASVLYEGILTITNVELFGQALRKGVGPGKAYGLGLLSIAPLGR